MFSGRHHPNDAALVRRYMADRGLDALRPTDEGVVRHVDVCTPCARRYLTVCEQLDAAAQVSVAAADEVWSADRLAGQRGNILRRVDGPGARVLSFRTSNPGSRVGRPPRPLFKWLAAAAAAGLFVGLSAGRILNLGGGTSMPDAPRSAMISHPAPVIGAARARPAALPADDDVFLDEVEVALSAPRIPELEAIDALTVNVRDPLPGLVKD